MAATEGALSELHVLVARVLEARLGDSDLCTAADINAAIKFLKDNNITASPEANKHLEELNDQLGKVGGIDPADDAELQAALDNVVNFRGALDA